MADADLAFSPRARFALYGAVRAKAPLVQNITNFVAMTFSANVLLAAGASPAMVHAEEEAEDFSAIASALVVNIGTLSPPWIGAMKRAAALYRARGKPWVLDPVGAGATRLRRETSQSLLDLKPAIVRANAGEILALAGTLGGAKGVDSLAGSRSAVAAAQSLSRQTGAVIAVTGEVDYVTDGARLAAIHGGHAMMARSTATGCALSALTGAFAAVAKPFEAAVAALSVYAAAGAIAASHIRGPGHLPASLIDALDVLDEPQLAAHSRVEIE
jgi:hydroxyethylthiazole kinase